MPRSRSQSLGSQLVRRRNEGVGQVDRAPRSGSRDLPVIRGLTQGCQFTMPMENVLAGARNVLSRSGRIYSYGNMLVLEVGSGESARLVPLVTEAQVAPYAASLLANLFFCEQAPTRDDQSPVQYPPPKPFAEVLLNSEPTWREVRQITTYATRPIFDEQYSFLGNGWHEEAGVLIHGPEVEPCAEQASFDPEAPALDRLPPRLCQLLRDFCFKSHADAVNAVGALLTGLLPTHFQNGGKGVLLVDGNQPGIGKTLLCRVIGTILGGEDPRTISFSADDEELNKRTAALLRESHPAILILDNAKAIAGRPISSPFVESNSMAAHITLRILGHSANIHRPNDMLWAITMNDTKVSPDLASRGLPIRLQHEGRPEERRFCHDPILYAREHRAELLGELAGMVIRWNQNGRPLGEQGHRCCQWASIVGGILANNGLPEFLTNLEEAASDFNSQLDDLAALAEAAVTMNTAFTYTNPLQTEE